MHTIDHRQRTPEWHAWRAQGITASEAPIILGRSPYKTPWQLWAERTGLHPPEDLSTNPVVQRGIALEDRVRQGFERRHRTLLMPLCAESSQYPVLRCSLDGLSALGEPVELKVPTVATYEAIRDQGDQATAYRLAWCQLQFQLYVTEATQGWLVFDPCRDGLEALEFCLPRDQSFIQDELVPACLTFWDLIQTGQAPVTDPTRDAYQPSEAERETWTRLAQDYHALKAERQRLESPLKAVQERLRDLETQFVTLMGASRQAEYAGVRVTRYRQSGAVDYAALLADIAPNLEASILERFRKPASERVKVTLHAPATGVDAEPVRASVSTIPSFYF
ncbi:YqaJ viral recombinase family protein [Allochromatium humboldtianum]|uniref:YqaJ viral recombinase family protein n=1 Tax=Allochromatium humboldtianum TaxID=504901 RepID=A0A850RDJ9_9GAMM|nr:YqaJ viral recombinase family protein [Allochromatium humboldtianum]NVZ11428.1 YqaJ viral recombinase family protein [Allochromatium humboldtianum]